MIRKIQYSLKYRIAIIIFILEAVMMSTVLTVTINHSLNERKAQLVVNEEVMAGLLADLSRLGLLTAEYDELQPYIDQVVMDPTIDAVLLANFKKRVVVSSEYDYIGRELPELQDSENTRWIRKDIENSNGYLGTLAMRFSHESLVKTNQEVMNLGITIALTGMVLIAIIGIVIGFLLTRRLEVLANTATRFADGDLEVRTKLTGNDEVAIVGQAFDVMAHNVSDNVEALKKATDQLEQRVEERTAELEIAKDEAVHANQSKGAFLATMSHEIRTPLTAIIGFSESLLDADQTMEQRVDSIHSIIRGGRHLLQIINDILDVSKVDANRLEVEKIPVNLFELLQDVEAIVSLLASERGLRFTTNYRFPLPNVFHSDPLRLKQILINVCNNAIKFTEEGSVSLEVQYLQDTNKVQIKIIDTGIGMSNDQMENLFQPFSQADSTISRKFGGTGLGLHLSKKLANLLDGDITVESTLDVGSRFIITVDAGDLSSVDMTTEIPETGIGHQATIHTDRNILLSGSVLLVEDNEDNQRLIGMYLTKAGATFEVASHGKQAIEILEQRGFDLILMDIQMPIMNGLEAARILRQKGDHTPIVALTANAMKSDMDACTDAGFNDFASKPIDRPTLNKLLARYLRPVEGKQPTMEPIVSTLLEEEPDLSDLVEEFAQSLPARVEFIKSAIEQKDMDSLKAGLHKLKGTGGNYGYPELFKLCQKMEFEVVAENFSNLASMMQDLAVLIERIRLGIGGKIVTFNKIGKA